MKSRSTYYTPPAALLLLLFFIALPTPGNTQAVTSAVDTANQLRAVGVQMKHALDHLGNTTMPDRETLNGFDRALVRSADAASNTGAALAEKHAALQRLRQQLEAKVHAAAAFGPAQPSAASGANPAAPTRRDIETVVAKHGDTCANALGVSTSLPVELVLAAPGHGRSDAWLRFDAATAGRVRFSTDSSGADPALAVFSSCAAGALALASNDDAFGLDAALTSAAAPGRALFVHLTNSGAGGRVTLQVVDASATISGTVLDAVTNLPLPNVYVDLFTTNSLGYASQGYTDQQGNYTISVSTGSYYVVARNDGYVGQIYPGIACLPNYYYSLSGCPVDQAQAVTLAAGGMATINFALNRGHSISGQLRDTANAPISGQAFVTLSDVGGTDVDAGQIDAYGRYSIRTLPPGSYRLRAGAPGYGSQMFDHKACAGPLQQTCDLSLATAINLADQDLRDFNFDLPLLTSIVGTVTPALSAGIYPSYPVVTVSTASGTVVLQTNADARGNYRAGPLDPGTYYVSVALGGYFSQLFSAVDCGENCIYSIPSGTAVMITGNGQLPRADFHLTPLPVLKGHVQDADSGLPLANVTVDFSKAPPAGQFYSFATAVTDNEGNFKTIVGAGNYYVWARSNDHIDQIFPNIPCEAGNISYYGNPPLTPCDVTGATVLAVLPGVTQPALNFTLVASSSISGSALLRAGPGSDLAATSLEVDLYNGTGVEVASANLDTQGNYILGDLPAATYYAVAQTYYSSVYVPQVWQLIDCHSTCVPTTGTPIPLARATTLTGINFQINQTDAVFGRVTDSHGNPIAGVLIDAFGSDGTYINTGTSDSQGYYRVETLAYGAFFVATEAGAKYTDQVYPAIACPAGPAFFGLCTLTGATPINVGIANTQPQIANFVLQAADKVFHNGFE